MIQYKLADDMDIAIQKIIYNLNMIHIDGSRIVCVRSRRSASRWTLACCHVLPRIIQIALQIKPHYIIEIISEQFDKLNTEEQTKMLIQELMHIHHSFGGGFRSHRPHVTTKKVEQTYKKFLLAC
jgi:predicted metallopeptidase